MGMLTYQHLGISEQTGIEDPVYTTPVYVDVNGEILPYDVRTGMNPNREDGVWDTPAYPTPYFVIPNQNMNTEDLFSYGVDPWQLRQADQQITPTLQPGQIVLAQLSDFQPEILSTTPVNPVANFSGTPAPAPMFTAPAPAPGYSAPAAAPASPTDGRSTIFPVYSPRAPENRGGGSVTTVTELDENGNPVTPEKKSGAGLLLAALAALAYFN